MTKQVCHFLSMRPRTVISMHIKIEVRRLCSASDNVHISEEVVQRQCEDGPWAPTLYNTCKNALLRVISHIRANYIDGTSEVAIRTANNVVCDGISFHRVQNS